MFNFKPVSFHSFPTCLFEGKLQTDTAGKERAHCCSNLCEKISNSTERPLPRLTQPFYKKIDVQGQRQRQSVSKNLSKATILVKSKILLTLNKLLFLSSS